MNFAAQAAKRRSYKGQLKRAGEILAGGGRLMFADAGWLSADGAETFAHAVPLSLAARRACIIEANGAGGLIARAPRREELPGRWDLED